MGGPPAVANALDAQVMLLGLFLEGIVLSGVTDAGSMLHRYRYHAAQMQVSFLLDTFPSEGVLPQRCVRALLPR